MGIADRSAYDLTCHAAATKTKLTAEAPLDKPISVETYQVSKKSLAALGKAFKKDAKVVGEALQARCVPPLRLPSPPPPPFRRPHCLHHLLRLLRRLPRRLHCLLRRHHPPPPPLLQALSTEELKALEAKAQAEGKAEIQTADGQSFAIEKECAASLPPRPG